jgi:uncharacterized protein (DUF433 family)
MIDERRFVADRDKAATIAGLTARQVDYWVKTGILTPTVETRLTPQRPIKLFDFTDLMALMTAAQLRRKGMSLQHIRAIVTHLRSQGYEKPLTEIGFAVLNGTLYLQRQDGTWESDRVPDQIVIHQVLDLQPLRARILQSSSRAEASLGVAERRRGVLGSKPVIAQTRIPVETIRRYLGSGRSTAEILAAFPVLRLDDIEAVRTGKIA